MNHPAIPVGGRIWTKPFKVLLVLFLISGALLLWRFAAGLGAVTALNDGYPWGLWIAYDVVVGTALACGGYAVAILLYVLNRGKYHPLIRPAILTSALGYSLAGFAVLIDVGRWWNLFKVPISFWHWNLNSILLEVALCIMAYMVVLWIELSPALLERWARGPGGRMHRVASRLSPVIEKSLVWIIALGLLLPTMHQSSLGSLMILAGQKVHPLWQTPLLPLLFLVSCIAMGYGVVVMESSLSTTIFNRPKETGMLAALSGAMIVVLLLYVVVRVVDLAVRGRLGLIAAFDKFSYLFLLEMLLFLLPAFMLLWRRRLRDPAYLFRAAMLIIIAGALYRFSTYLLAYSPTIGNWSYFPAVPELLVTVGLVAFEVLAYILIVKEFPILAGLPARAETQGAAR